VQITNVSPYGDLDIDGIGQVARGATFTVPSADVAAALLVQTFNYAPGDGDAEAVVRQLEQLQQAAADQAVQAEQEQVVAANNPPVDARPVPAPDAQDMSTADSPPVENTTTASGE
jgi:hypothetical protein